MAEMACAQHGISIKRRQVGFKCNHYHGGASIDLTRAVGTQGLADLADPRNWYRSLLAVDHQRPRRSGR